MERTKLNINKIEFCDLTNEPLIISKYVIDLLLKQNNPGNLIALYCFYYYITKYKTTNQLQITTEFIAKAFNWNIEKVQKYKKQLNALKIINNSFVIPLQKSPPSDTPPKGVLSSPQNKIKNIIPPTIEDIKAYCKERKNKVDPETFFDFNTSKGWLIGKVKMKDWQAAIRTWEKRDDKIKESNGKQKVSQFLPEHKYWDGMRYDLNKEDGGYYHCKSGDRYC